MANIPTIPEHVWRMIRFLPQQFKKNWEPPNPSTGDTQGVDNNLTEFLKALASEIDEIEATLIDLLTMRTILTAEGVNLDNIGALLNIPRPYTDTDLEDYFGFQGATEAIPFGFGDPADPSVGGVLAAPGVDITGDRLMLDSEYRTLLLVASIRNNHMANHDNLIRAVKLSTGALDVVVTYLITTSGKAELTFSRALTGSERIAIRLAQPYLPIPLGCQVDIIDS